MATLAPPARSLDTYSAAEAGKVLGVSERRVRQLVEAGKLPAITTEGAPLRLQQSVVHDLRTRRRRAERSPDGRSPGKGLRAGQGGIGMVDAEKLVELMFARTLQPALEASTAAHRAVEKLLQDTLIAERADRAQMAAQLEAATARVVELEQQLAAAAQPRRLFGRRG